MERINSFGICGHRGKYYNFKWALNLTRNMVCISLYPKYPFYIPIRHYTWHCMVMKGWSILQILVIVNSSLEAHCYKNKLKLDFSDGKNSEISVKEYVDGQTICSGSLKFEGINLLPQYLGLFFFNSTTHVIERDLQPYWSHLKLPYEDVKNIGLGLHNGNNYPLLSTVGEYWISIRMNASVMAHNHELLIADDNFIFSGGCNTFNTWGKKTNLKVSIPTSECQWKTKNVTHNDRVIVLPIGKYGYIAYYHFWTETIPHWFILPKEFREDTKIKVLIEPLADFIKFAIKIMGIDKSRIIDIDRFKSCRYVFREVIIPTIPHCAIPQLPELKLLRQHLDLAYINNVQTLIQNPSAQVPPNLQQGNQNTLIVIHRKKSRAVFNTDDMVMALKKVYEPEYLVVKYDEMKMEETIKLFRSAKVIIGHHGAGLVNMLFSKYTGVIEIHDASPISPDRPGGVVICYATLSRLLEFPYYGLLGDRKYFDVDKVLKYVTLMINLLNSKQENE